MNPRLFTALLALVVFTASCAGGGSSRMHYRHGMGYGSYYGGGPWYGHPVYIDDATNYPEHSMAETLPAYGMPDGGGFDMGGFDMGGFDY